MRVCPARVGLVLQQDSKSAQFGGIQRLPECSPQFGAGLWLAKGSFPDNADTCEGIAIERAKIGMVQGGHGFGILVKAAKEFTYRVATKVYVNGRAVSCRHGRRWYT